MFSLRMGTECLHLVYFWEIFEPMKSLSRKTDLTPILFIQFILPQNKMSVNNINTNINKNMHMHDCVCLLVIAVYLIHALGQF